MRNHAFPVPHLQRGRHPRQRGRLRRPHSELWGHPNFQLVHNGASLVNRAVTVGSEGDELECSELAYKVKVLPTWEQSTSDTADNSGHRWCVTAKLFRWKPSEFQGFRELPWWLGSKEGLVHLPVSDCWPSSSLNNDERCGWHLKYSWKQHWVCYSIGPQRLTSEKSHRFLSSLNMLATY